MTNRLFTLTDTEAREVEAAISASQANCPHSTECLSCKVLHGVISKMDEAGLPKSDPAESRGEYILQNVENVAKTDGFAQYGKVRIRYRDGIWTYSEVHAGHYEETITRTQAIYLLANQGVPYARERAEKKLYAADFKEGQ